MQSNQLGLYCLYIVQSYILQYKFITFKCAWNIVRNHKYYMQIPIEHIYYTQAHRHTSHVLSCNIIITSNFFILHLSLTFHYHHLTRIAIAVSNNRLNSNVLFFFTLKLANRAMHNTSSFRNPKIDDSAYRNNSTNFQ